MKLEEIKGERQIQVMGMLMTLADTLSEEEQFDAFMEAMKSDEERDRALFKLGPLLTRKDIAEGIVKVVAFAKGIEPEEVDNPMGEVIELVNSDVELPAFLSERQ